MLVAIFGLMVLKVLGSSSPGIRLRLQSAAGEAVVGQENFNFPGSNRAAAIVDQDITGSTHGAPGTKKGREEGRGQTSRAAAETGRRHNLSPRAAVAGHRRRAGDPRNGCRLPLRTGERAREVEIRSLLKAAEKASSRGVEEAKATRSEGLGREQPEAEEDTTCPSRVSSP